MIESRTQTEVRYSETDMMGIVYHANYLSWLEMGRINLLKEHGLSYRQMEEEGLLLPVLEIQLKFIKPARFEDQIVITTWMRSMPYVKIKLEYEISRGEEILATGHSLHAFMNREARPIKTPKVFLDKMRDSFN